VGSGSGDHDPARDPARSQVFDPVEGGLGDEVRVEVTGGNTPGEPIGTVTGQGIENLPLQSYVDRYADYRDHALDSLDRMVIPQNLAELVRQYFTELEP
jgi:hypothetical protein